MPDRAEQYHIYQLETPLDERTLNTSLLEGNTKRFKPVVTPTPPSGYWDKIDWARTHPEQDSQQQDEHLLKNGVK